MADILPLRIASGEIEQFQTSDTVGTANGGTGATTILGARTNLGVNTYIDTMNLLGSAAVSQTFGSVSTRASGNLTLSSGALTYVLMDAMPAGLTILGVKFLQVTQGVYTASNNNRLGVSSLSAGTHTLVASCANDGNLWKGANNTVQTKAFTSSFITVANTAYYITYLFSSSSTSTAPIISLVPASTATAFTLDFTNSAKLGGFVAAQTDLASSQASSGLTALTGAAYLLLYI